MFANIEFAGNSRYALTLSTCMRPQYGRCLVTYRFKFACIFVQTLRDENMFPISHSFLLTRKNTRSRRTRTRAQIKRSFAKIPYIVSTMSHFAHTSMLFPINLTLLLIYLFFFYFIQMNQPGTALM